VFLQADQAGAEALVVAYLCREGNFRRLFQNGIKSHVFVALHAFKTEWQMLHPNVDVEGLCKLLPHELKTHPGFKEVEKSIKASDDWPASRRYYYIAKMICHACNYGMKPPTFLINVLDKSEGMISLTLEQATRFVNLYHALFPEIQEWHRATQGAIEESRTLYNLFGYPRYFNGTIDDALMRDAYSYVPQSTVGTITNLAFVKFQNYIEEHNKTEWDLLNNKHDSYLAQVPESDVAEASSVMIDYICPELIGRWGDKFKMKAETQIGKNWGHYDPEHNPEGLRPL